MFSIFLTIFLLSLRDAYSMENCRIEFCNGTSSNYTDVEKFCETERKDAYMLDRCCISNETETVIGLDLSSCQIQHITATQINFTDLIVMDLRENNLKSVTSGDLIGLVNLTKLWVPNWISCPGGSRAWNTTESNLTYCYLQENPCDYLNISCTINGVCKHLGPGSAKCVCIPGHYGYKCMNEGEFPVTAFSIALTVSTIVLSLILWFAQGRDAYRKR